MLTQTRKREIEYAFIIIALTMIVKLLCIGSNDLLGEESYYWNYSNHLDFSYLDHPPMVAILIKLFTTLFGMNEFGMRIGSIVCWLATAMYSFKLTQQIKQGAGHYAVMLLAILPFFFLHSLIITPDLPLIVCWSAALYYLYRALVQNHPTAWYAAGLWLGLGMLSKYTIVLLGLATLSYLVMVPPARKWFFKKEPYACLLITVLLFTPVIYWNATHEWVSFGFQSTRRLHDEISFSFHQLLGLFVLFLTPLGVISFLTLFKKNSAKNNGVDIQSKRFFQVFTLVPLAVFSLFSVTHEIKFNWIGPSLLAIIPWLAILIEQSKPSLRRGWFITSTILLIVYCGMLFCIISGKPNRVNQWLFTKYISWNDFTRQVNAIASEIETKTKKTPIIVPMDYIIGSELTFYQKKLLTDGKIPKVFKVIGNDIFGFESLMFHYWSKGVNVSGKPVLLVGANTDYFGSIATNIHVVAPTTAPQAFWSHSQGSGTNVKPFYYQVFQMKETGDD